MLDALSEVFHVRFEERELGDDVRLAAWVLDEATGDTLQRSHKAGFPSYVVIHNKQGAPEGERSTIEFSMDPALPALLRGRQVNTEEARKINALPQLPENASVLASKVGAPVWAMQEIEGRQHHWVSWPIPELNDGEGLFQYFHGQQFLQLLPLLQFLRTVTEDRRWKPPPLQACFMFDDPNLHWRRYGFIDFAEMANHAQIHTYHVCFATIPLDTWFVHTPTAVLFQQYGKHVSLVIHGNDHTAEELARIYTDAERDRTLRQSLGRISAFEDRSGVQVARVMVPPHGACREVALSQMAQLGFEAACISSGSLRRYNAGAPWINTLGMRPSDIIGGLPVFNRFPLSGRCHNSILAAALLHQPIIARGHHSDVAGGLGLLADLSSFVNSLGTVHWADMERISRSHYARRIDGRDLYIRMFTRWIEVCVPEGTNQIWVERPEFWSGESMDLSWRVASKSLEWTAHRPDAPIPARPNERLEISIRFPTTRCIDAKDVRRFRLWPVVRRQLTEARDRMSPVLRRAFSSE